MAAGLVAGQAWQRGIAPADVASAAAGLVRLRRNLRHQVTSLARGYHRSRVPVPLQKALPCPTPPAPTLPKRSMPSSLGVPGVSWADAVARKLLPDAAAGPVVPERWAVDAGDAAQALLLIPADLQRERRFEIACAMTVRCGDDLDGAWHEMTVLANGALQWQRRIASHNPGSFDGLDYRFARTLAVGEALRLVLRCACRGVSRQRLLIEADEA